MSLHEAFVAYVVARNTVATGRRISLNDAIEEAIREKLVRERVLPERRQTKRP